MGAFLAFSRTRGLEVMWSSLEVIFGDLIAFSVFSGNSKNAFRKGPPLPSVHFRLFPEIAKMLSFGSKGHLERSGGHMEQSGGHFR